MQKNILTQLDLDMVIYILKKCNYKQLIAIKNTCKEFKNIVYNNKFIIIQKRLEYKLLPTIRRLKHTTNKHVKLHRCLNVDCINKNKILQIKNVNYNMDQCMGIVYFYYPKTLTPNIFSRYNDMHDIRQEQCKIASWSKHYIHYCEDCMIPHLHFRDDGQEIPFGNKDGKIFN